MFLFYSLIYYLLVGINKKIWGLSFREEYGQFFLTFLLIINLISLGFILGVALNTRFISDIMGFPPIFIISYALIYVYIRFVFVKKFRRKLYENNKKNEFVNKLVKDSTRIGVLYLLITIFLFFSSLIIDVTSF